MRLERRLGYETEGRRLHARERADSALNELLWSGGLAPKLSSFPGFTKHALLFQHFNP